MLSQLKTRLHSLKARLAGEDGFASTVILVPASLVVLFLGFQAAIWYLGQDTAQNAAQAGYTVARSYQSDPSSGVDAANQVIRSMHAFLPDAHVDVQRTPTTVTVTVTGRPESLLPGLNFPPVQRSVTGPVERWVPAP
jgi:hypothetical protein